MIHPTDEQLLAGIAEALRDTVLPDLARGSASRKQLQAAIEILRRLAFAGPGKAAALAADNADMAEVIGRIETVMSDPSPLEPSASPLEGEVGRQSGRVGGSRSERSQISAESRRDQSPPPGPSVRPPLQGGRRFPDGTDDPAAQNKALQARLTELQTNIPPDLSPQIAPILIGLHKRMTDRAIALIPSPTPRTPRKSP